MVAGSRDGGKSLELVLVDVSGKGLGAGVRSLQLSGRSAACWVRCRARSSSAAANGYLLDQDWEEGFATAIHVAVDLPSGDFWVSSAGHPPAVQRHAGSGRLERRRHRRQPRAGRRRGLRLRGPSRAGWSAATS